MCNDLIPTVCKERFLPFYCVCESVFLPDDGCNRQPKHVVELNKNQCTTSTRHIVVFSEINKHLFNKTGKDYVTEWKIYVLRLVFCSYGFEVVTAVLLKIRVLRKVHGVECWILPKFRITVYPSSWTSSLDLCAVSFCSDTHGTQCNNSHRSDLGCDIVGVCASVPESRRGHIHLFLHRAHCVRLPRSWHRQQTRWLQQTSLPGALIWWFMTFCLQ
jgi:hypothetical protein